MPILWFLFVEFLKVQNRTCSNNILHLSQVQDHFLQSGHLNTKVHSATRKIKALLIKIVFIILKNMDDFSKKKNHDGIHTTLAFLLFLTDNVCLSLD